MIRLKSVRRYCIEDPSKIENYDKAIADERQIWDCHHRTETRKKLSETNKRIPSAFKGRTHSVEAKTKISLAHKEKVPWNKGKPVSEDLRRRLSESHKNISPETRRRMSEASKLREANKRKMRASMSESSINGGTSYGC